MKINIWCTGLVSIFLLISTVCSAKVIVKTNITDCANCTLAFNQLVNMSEINQLNILFPESFKNNKEDIKEKYGFKESDRLQLVFSDSIYSFLDSQTENFSSEIFIFNSKNSLIYKDNLRSMLLSEVRFFAENDHAKKIDFPQLSGVNFNNISIQKNVVMATDYFNRLYVINLVSKKIDTVDKSKELTEGIYKRVYGKKFKKQYKVMQVFFKKYPTIKPKLTSTSLFNEGRDVLMLYEFRYYKILSNKDTGITSSKIIVNYNLKTKKFVHFLLPEGSLGKDRILHRWEFFQNSPYLLSTKLTKDKSYLQDVVYTPIILDMKNLVFKKGGKEIKNFYPMGYFKNQEAVRYRVSIFNSSNTILPCFSDSIYNVNKGAKIRIPFKTKRKHFMQYTAYNNSFNTYSQVYHVLYTFEKGIAYQHLAFNKNGTVLNDEIVKNDEGININSPLGFYHSNQLIYYNRTEGSFRTVDL